mgnify:CR=1 FL=1
MPTQTEIATNVAESFTNTSDRVLDAVLDGNRRVVDTVVKTADDVNERLPEMPWAERLPTAGEAGENYMEFVERAVEANRDFNHRVAKMITAESIEEARGYMDDAAKDVQDRTSKVVKDARGQVEKATKDTQDRTSKVVKDAREQVEKVAKDTQDQVTKVAKDVQGRVTGAAEEAPKKAATAKKTAVKKAAPKKATAKKSAPKKAATKTKATAKKAAAKVDEAVKDA